MPSFVPDWALELSGGAEDLALQRSSQRWSLLDSYDACLGSDVEFSSKPGILIIRGRVFDIVQSIASRPLEDASTLLNDPRIIDELLRIANIPPRHADPGQKKREEFWVTMCAGILPKDLDQSSQLDEVQSSRPISALYERINRLQDERSIAYEEFCRSLNVDKLNAIRRGELADGPQDAQMVAAVRDTNAQRIGMATQRGSIGLAPSNANVGDVVAVFTGGRVPIILRPQTGYYTVVGDAYVHGIMDRGAMRDTKELEWIELH